MKYLRTALFALLFISPPSEAKTIALPGPTGPNAVGRLMFHWTDLSRPEVLSAKAADRREISVWIWYPAQVAGNAAFLPYIDQLSSLAAVLQKSEVSLAQAVQIHAVGNAGVAPGSSPFPVLVFSPGAASLAALYTTFCEEFASRGFVVVSIDHPYDSAAVKLNDGRIAVPPKPPKEGEEILRLQRQRVTVRAQDVLFVLARSRRSIGEKLRLP